ncbi:hypothetical protein ACOSQ4_003231 [Xanthoceras sorbifolium]
MPKVYDRVEWSFLQGMLIRLGFSFSWVTKIMDCVSSIAFSCLINGAPTGCVIPSWGLCQGDPLSPYLFLVCAEGLSALLRYAERNGSISRIRCGRIGPQISHLFFADDSFLFSRARLSDCETIKALLFIYSQASGQLVNFSKSAISFSPQVSQNEQHLLAGVLGVSVVNCHTKYLGLPSFSGRGRSCLFSSLKERIWQRLK